MYTVYYPSHSMTSIIDGSSPRKSQSCEINSAGKEIHNYHGVVHAWNSGAKEDDQHSNGTLSIIQQDGNITLEWRPNEVAVDTETQEEEWALVNTKSRSRTSSGSVEYSSAKIQNLIISIKDEVSNIKICHKKNRLILNLKDNKQKLFFFHFENLSNFIHELNSVITLKKSDTNPDTFFVEEASASGMAPSFSDLSLDEVKSHNSKLNGGIKPTRYENTLLTFSKFTEYISFLLSILVRKNLEHQRMIAAYAWHAEDLVYRTHESRPEEEIEQMMYSSQQPDPEVDKTYHFVSPVIGPLELKPRIEPLPKEQWDTSKDENGKIMSPLSIRDRIFRGGVSPNLRSEIWKFLLCYYPWDSIDEERKLIVEHKSEEYYRMKKQWETISSDQESRFTQYRDRKTLVEKDVNRTDRNLPFYAGENNPNLEMLSNVLMTYVMYNFDLGYVQGMSDLLSPIIIVMKNEVDSFWCFVGFMNLMHRNFDLDQTGMKRQLSQLHTLLTAVSPELSTYFDSHEAGNMSFCFRWLLVWFKREFSLEDTMRLWEVLWTGLPCPNFHLLIAIAILEGEKTPLTERDYGLCEILKHTNDLSFNMNLDEILMRATAIYSQLEQSKNLTASTQRVIGLSNDLAKEKSNASSEDMGCSDILSQSSETDTSIENGYNRGLENSFF